MTLALASSPQTPSVLAPFTAEASPAPAAPESPLPEIGRTRSVAPACAAYRDLVIPSVRAAMKADTRFARSREHLAQYVYHADDVINWGRAQYMNATNINRDALAMLAESLVISRALGDPRLRKDSPDAQIQAERAALQKLYDVQNGRAWLLYNFSARAMRDDIATREGAGFQPNAAKAGAKPQQPAPSSDPHALPTPESGLPEIHGIPPSDQQQVDMWMAEVATEVRAAEASVVPSLRTLSHGCL